MEQTAGVLEKLDAALAVVPDFVYTFDLRGRFTYANGALHRLLERRPGEMVGLDFHDLSYPEPLASTLQTQIQEVIATQSMVRAETPYESAAGVGYYEYIFVPIMGEDGRVAGVAGTTREITERRTTEDDRKRLVAELTIERERLQTLFRLSPSAIALIRGHELRFVYANQTYLKIVGRDDIVGKPLLEALPEIEGQGFVELLHGVMETGQPFSSAEMPVLLKPQENEPAHTLYVNLLYQAMPDIAGATPGIFVHAVDVTDQVVARNQISEREELFRTIFESAPDDAIIVMDGDRTVIGWNPAATRICGWVEDEMVGRSADLIFTPEERGAGAPQAEADAAALEDKVANERWHMRKDGSRFWSSGTLNSLHRPDGSVRGFLKVFRDATVRHEAERQIQAANDSLESKVRERTAQIEAAIKDAEGFNYTIAHDLRTPLRAISSTASILIEEAGAELGEEHRELLGRQSENAIRLGRLIDELLRLSRLARVEMNRQPLDMTAKALRVAEELREEGRHRGCEVEVEPGMTATGDADLVRLVLQNLIGNACKFSLEGRKVRVGKTGETFYVRDEGVGFDMKFAPKIFLPFERLVADSEFEGTGIGLANVERIVRRHGGLVWAESEPGKGATFFFTLG